MYYNFIKRILLIAVPNLIRLLGLKPPALAGVCAFIQNSKGEILTIDLAYKKGLSLPGGGVDVGESLEAALVREIKEETNLEVKSFKYLWSDFYKKGGFGVVSACFDVEIKDIKQLKNSSEGAITWETPDRVYKECAYPDIKKHLARRFSLS